MCFCVLLYFTACMLYYCNTVRWAWWDWGLIWWLTILLQCFDSVGWVTWPVKISSPNDLYCVEWDAKPYSNQIKAQGVTDAKNLGEIPTTSPPMGAPKRGGVGLNWAISTREQLCRSDAVPPQHFVCLRRSTPTTRLRWRSDIGLLLSTTSGQSRLQLLFISTHSVRARFRLH